MLDEERRLPLEFVGHRSAWRERPYARAKKLRAFVETLRALLGTLRPFLAMPYAFVGTLCPFLGTPSAFLRTPRPFLVMLCAFRARHCALLETRRASVGRRYSKRATLPSCAEHRHAIAAVPKELREARG